MTTGASSAECGVATVASTFVTCWTATGSYVLFCSAYASGLTTSATIIGVETGAVAPAGAAVLFNDFSVEV